MQRASIGSGTTDSGVKGIDIQWSNSRTHKLSVPILELTGWEGKEACWRRSWEEALGNGWKDQEWAKRVAFGLQVSYSLESKLLLININMASVTVGRQYSTTIGYLNIKKFKKHVINCQPWVLDSPICPYLLQITVRFLGERRMIDVLSDTQLPQLSTSTLQVLSVHRFSVLIFTEISYIYSVPSFRVF